MEEYMANMALNDLYSIKVNYAKTIELLNKGKVWKLKQ